MSRPAVVLLSGGLDSTTCLAIAHEKNFDCYCLTINYGQRHAVELEAGKRVATTFRAVGHVQLDIDLRVFGGSALTGDLAVPKHETSDSIISGIPVTYVPARNTIMLSYALAWAEVLKAKDIFIGVNAVDYSGYPDCRPEFIEAFQKMSRLATKAGVQGTAPVTIHAPLIDLTKAEIIKLGTSLGIDYGLTHSCYDPTKEGKACGHCDSCLLRKKGFEEAGVPDPTSYADQGGLP